MKKNILIFFMVLFLSAFLFAKEKMFSYIPFKSAKWISKITIESPSGKQILNQTTFYKSGKMRIEGKDPQGNEYITIINKNFVYVINTKENQGVKYAVESKQNPEKNNLEIEKCRKSANKTGTEKINNINCDIIEFYCVIDKIKFSIKEWKSQKDNFIIKSITKVEGTTTTTEILELKKDTKISDDKFIPDKKIKFTDMQSIFSEESSKKGNDEKMMKDIMKKMMENSQK